MNRIPAEVADVLARNALAADRGEWPAASWEALAHAGLLTPETAAARTALQEQVARHCLTTAFILSQREAAVRQLARGPVGLLDRYASAGYVTVGLSQLTTSRQHGTPALLARPHGDEFLLTGIAPWVTGAERADAIVIGASLEDGEQLIGVVPSATAGMTPESPMPLAALVGSGTAAIRFDSVRVARDQLIAGPMRQVLGPVGGGGLDTSALALGHARAACDLLTHEAGPRPDLADVAARFRDATDRARVQLLRFAAEPAEAEATLNLRVAATNLALGASQAALTASKGAGFLAPHPAERLARQALFFLVWSCPRPVAGGVLDRLLPEQPTDKPAP